MEKLGVLDEKLSMLNNVMAPVIKAATAVRGISFSPLDDHGFAQAVRNVFSENIRDAKPTLTKKSLRVPGIEGLPATNRLKKQIMEIIHAFNNRIAKAAAPGENTTMDPESLNPDIGTDPVWHWPPLEKYLRGQKILPPHITPTVIKLHQKQTKVTGAPTSSHPSTAARERMKKSSKLTAKRAQEQSETETVKKRGGSQRKRDKRRENGKRWKKSDQYELN